MHGLHSMGGAALPCVARRAIHAYVGGVGRGAGGVLAAAPFAYAELRLLAWEGCAHVG